MAVARDGSSGNFLMRGVALAAALMCVGAIAWRAFGDQGLHKPPTAAYNIDTTTNSSIQGTTTGALTLTPIGASVYTQLANAYTDLADRNAYTPAAGEEAAKAIASKIRPSVTSHIYTEADLNVGEDTSRARLLAYRSDLQAALKPLLKNTQYELTIYADYTATKNPNDLVLLQNAALNYHQAALNLAALTVPRSAIEVHLGVLNALERFGSTLAAQVASAADPYASAALLSGYNTAESDVFLSFNTLAQFFRDKIKS